MKITKIQIAMKNNIKLTRLIVAFVILFSFLQTSAQQPSFNTATNVNVGVTFNIQANQVYKFQAPKDLIVAINSGSSPWIFLNDTVNEYTDIKRMGSYDTSRILIKVNVNDNVYFYWNYIYDEYALIDTLSNLPESGNKPGNAIQIFEGKTVINTEADNVKWLKYIFPADGSISIITSANYLFTYSGIPTKYSSLWMNTINFIEEKLLNLASKNYYTNEPANVKLNGKAGDVVYIRIFDDYLTAPEWSVQLNFHRFKVPDGHTRANPIMLKPGVNKYPLTNYFESKKISAFVLPSGKFKITIKNANNGYGIVDSLQLWEARLPQQPFIVNNTKSYRFFLGIYEHYNTRAADFVEIEVTADTSNSSSSYGLSNNITQVKSKTQYTFNPANNPNMSYKFQAPADGFLKINKNSEFSFSYFSDPYRVNALNNDYSEGVLIKKDSTIYFAPSNYVKETFSFIPEFIKADSLLLFDAYYYYYHPSYYIGDELKAKIDTTGNKYKIELPYQFDEDITLKIQPVPGSEIEINNQRYSYQQNGSVEISFSMSNSSSYNTLEIINGESGKTYTIEYSMRTSTLTGNDIVNFELLDNVLDGSVNIDNDNKTITAKVKWINSSYRAKIVLSEGAIADPSSGYINNDNNNLIYNFYFVDNSTSFTDDITVIAENGNAKTYTITITRDPMPDGFDCQQPIVANSGGNSGNWPENYIFKYTPTSTKAIVITGIKPLTGGYNYFYYDDDCSEFYNSREISSSDDKIIIKGTQSTPIYFKFTFPVSSFTINEIPYLTSTDVISAVALYPSQIYMELPCDIDRNNRIIWVKGNPYSLNIKLSNEGELYYNNEKVTSYYFTPGSYPATITLKAMDGSEFEWTIRQLKANSESRILSFTVPGQIAPTQIDEKNKKILCWVDNTVNLTKVIPAFELSEGASAFIDTVQQISGFSNVNFTSTVNYNIIAEDNSSTITYTVEVKKATTPELLSINLHGQVNTPFIDYTSGKVYVSLYPYVDKSNVKTYYSVTSGSSVTVNGESPKSGDPINYVTSPVSFIVKDGPTNVTRQVYVSQLAKPCKANFSYTISNDTVYFTNLSEGKNLYYSWNFGDGSSVTISDPFYVYEPGVYVVSLTILDEETGCIDIFSQKIEIGTSSLCKASFSYNIQPLLRKVTLTNNSKGGNYYWDFGDGTASVDASPVKIYSNPGVYKITLIATNNLKTCRDVESVVISIGDSCNASFSYWVDTLDNRIKLYSDDNRNTLKHIWELPDGSISTADNVDFTINQKGYYTVTHTVVNPVTNCIDRASEAIKVGEWFNDCEADFIVLPDGNALRFYDKSKGQGINKWTWNMGDGTIYTQQNPSHTYNASGTYLACLTVANNQGGVNTKCKKVFARPLEADNCEADFGYLITDMSLSVKYFDKSKGAPTNYQWNFGDNSTSTNQNPTHAFTSAGDYLTLLTISNNNNCNDQSAKLISVGKEAGYRFKFIAIQNPDLRKAGGYPIDFIGAGLGEPARIKWDFGDGSIDTTTLNPTHVYSQPGTYNVCFTAVDPVTESENTYCQVVVVQGTSVKPIAQNEVWNIYPVPFESQIYIQLNNPEAGQVVIDLFDITGRKLASIVNKYLPSGVITLQYETNNLPSGTYLIQLRTSTVNQVMMVVKK